MPLKKSDLYASLWASCDALRGGMDASMYKDYVQFMLLIKYVSASCATSNSKVDTLRRCPRNSGQITFKVDGPMTADASGGRANGVLSSSITGNGVPDYHRRSVSLI